MTGTVHSGANPRGPVFALVAPTYNNASTLMPVIRSAEGLGLPIIVVNDGSTDSTADILAAWERDPRGGGVRRVLHHPRNRGKADAMRAGFAEAIRIGCSHAATVDTDGQHDLADVPALLTVARDCPRAIVVGVRPLDSDVYPLRSRLGRMISNRMVRLESGVRVRDSQCGLRVYPIASTIGLECVADRYGFETEILSRAAWAGIPVLEAPIRCIYAVPGGRVSHFKPVRDSLAACAMHARLLTESFERQHATTEPGGVPEYHRTSSP